MDNNLDKKLKIKKIINVIVYLFATLGVIFFVLVLFELAKGNNEEEKTIDNINNNNIVSEEIYDGVVYDENSF